MRAFEQKLLMNEHPAACVGVCDTPDLGAVRGMKVLSTDSEVGEEQQLSCSNC